MPKMNILVTGVGSPLGQSIYKALKMSSLELTLFLMDSYTFSIASVLNERHASCAFLKDPKYIDEFASYCKKNEISGVFWGTEIEAAFYSKNVLRFNELCPKIIFFSDLSKLSQDIQDKYYLAKYLASKQVPAPLSASGENKDEVDSLIKEKGFPLILKPKRGASSVGFKIIKQASELKALHDEDANKIVIQECLTPSDEEYTVGVYRSRDGVVIADTVIRRELKFGLTYKALVVKDPEISDYCKRLSHAINSQMSCNIQLMKTSKGPIVFEVNPRFSSTTSIRAHFGVNEPELAIREWILCEKLKPFEGRTGAALRMWEEKYLTDDDVGILNKQNPWDTKI